MKMHWVPVAVVERELTADWMVPNWPPFLTVIHPAGAVVLLAANAAATKFKVARSFMVMCIKDD